MALSGSITQPQCPYLPCCSAKDCPAFNVLPFYYGEELGCRLGRNQVAELRRARFAYEKDFTTEIESDED